MGLWKSLAESLGRQAEDDNQALTPELAAAVLLIAMERADFEKSHEERSVIERSLASHFGLAPGELETLLCRAEEEAGESVSFYDYVQNLNDSFSYEDKCAVLRMLWEVAYADGKLDPFEEQLMRRLADMLYMPHKEYVRIKLEVTGQ